jgi:lysozyme
MSQLESLEGRETCAYPDPITRGKPWTIGIGHTGPEVVPGLVWTDAQIDAAFQSDVAIATAQCRASFPWFDNLNEPRQAVLIGMVFQMGLPRVLRFTDALAGMRDEHWPHAAECMWQSRWARQTPRRAVRMARQIETGVWA